MMRVLIVDDREDNRYLLRVLLQCSGFEVAEAVNGQQGLEMAQAHVPDLVICDLLMPVMDGYTMLGRWKADATLRRIPFMVYTATYTESKDEKLALDMGADAFVVKPTEPEVLLRLVQDLLKNAAQRQPITRDPVIDEPQSLKVYNEVLIAKLEKRSAQLEQRVAELHLAQQQVLRMNRLYLALSETNQAIVHAPDRNSLFSELCRIAVQRGGLALAWVGWIDPVSQEVLPVARSGPEPAWFKRLAPLSLLGPPHIELVLNQGQPYLSNNLQTDPALAAIASELAQMGFQSAASFPLFVDDRLVGAVSLFAAECDFFDRELLELLTEMVSDVCFALSNFEKEAQRRLGQELLRASEEACRLNSQAVQASANGILIAELTASGHSIDYVNPAFERITGYGTAEIRGGHLRFLMGTDLQQFGALEIDMAERERREGNAILRCYRKDGTLFWNDLSIAPVRNAQGQATHLVAIINDITERKQYEEQLERHNNQDALTGLASRSLLKQRAEMAIAFANRQHRSVALLFLNLDHFKRINDSLGHLFGDAILLAVAQLLSASMRERDTLARVGGNDFVIVISDLGSPQDVPLIASKLLHSIASPINLQGREINLSASMGVSLYPQDGDDYETLIRNADAAMYRAKDAGRNTFRFYTADMNAQALRKLELEAGLRHALDRDELLLYYQPLQDLNNGEITDAEALIRWRNRDGMLLSPLEFIPLAEETGLIVPIGQWVLRTACVQACQWRSQGIELRVAVNLSTLQFCDVKLVQIVRDALLHSGLPAHLLKLEITESAVMQDAEQAVRILFELKALGVGVSVDDFGTGYSSLAYLQRFPIDQLKIDRSFVQAIASHPESASIVHSIIGLARSLRLQTVGEGVETLQQRDFLCGAGCDLMQGFLLSRPLPAADFFNFVQAQRLNAARSL